MTPPASHKEPTATDAPLLPCPFCGSEPEFETPRPSNWKTYSARCANPKCNVKPHACDLAATAITAWNTRFMEAKPDPEGLREALEAARIFVDREARCLTNSEEAACKLLDRIDAALTAKPSLEPIRTELVELADELEDALKGTTARPWVAFDSGDRKATLAVMKGRRPKKRADGRYTRWPEIIAWPGFDAADVPHAQRRANLHLIVEVVNALPKIIAAFRLLSRNQPGGSDG